MRWAAVAALTALAACAPLVAPRGPLDVQPYLGRAADGATVFVTRDGLSLGFESWEADRTRAVVVAFHGMNDYARFVRKPAAYWRDQGITTLAIDQRGFGRSPNVGVWAGADAMIDDARDLVDLARRRYPGVPVHVLGESMGGAVVLSMLARPDAPAHDGAILVAPAVWGFGEMPLSHRVALWIAARIAPGFTFTGSDLGVTPSDNHDALVDLGSDPLVIKPTRPDAIYGLAELMQRGLESGPRVRGPVLVLYGEKDEIVPREPVERLIASMSPTTRVALYPNGYHLLMRDVSGPKVWDDVLAFVDGAPGPLPSGAETSPQAIVADAAPELHAAREDASPSPR